MKGRTFLAYKLIAGLLAMFFFGYAAQEGQCIPQPMTPPRMVNDFAGLFDPHERELLERQIREYETSTSTQIYVVTVSDLEGNTSLQLATLIGNKWGIGQKSVNNGIVLLIKPKTHNERGEVAIALGDGIELVLSQRTAQGIIDHSLLPLFKKGLFFEGVQQTVYTLGIVLADIFSHNRAVTASPNSSVPAHQPSSNKNIEAWDALENQNRAFSVTEPIQPSVSSSSERQSGAELPAEGAWLLYAGIAFIVMLVGLVVTGHGRLAGKILLGVLALFGALFALGALFGDSSGKNRGGGPFSGGGGGSFSGGGASGSW